MKMKTLFTLFVVTVIAVAGFGGEALAQKAGGPAGYSTCDEWYLAWDKNIKSYTSYTGTFTATEYNDSEIYVRVTISNAKLPFKTDNIFTYEFNFPYGSGLCNGLTDVDLLNLFVLLPCELGIQNDLAPGGAYFTMTSAVTTKYTTCSDKPMGTWTDGKIEPPFTYNAFARPTRSGDITIKLVPR